MIKADTIILLPAHNEEKAIGKVIDGIYRVGYKDIVVSASGCTDHTAEVAKQHRAYVLHAPLGKGAAIRYAVSQIDARRILMMDSDGTYPVESIKPMLSLLGTHDAVIGVRRLNHDNIPILNHWGNSFITAQARILYGYPIQDLCTGMWAFQGCTFRLMDIESQGFTLEAEMFIWLVKQKLKIAQLPIDYHPRIGKSHINRLDHLRIMAYLWSRRFS